MHANRNNEHPDSSRWGEYRGAPAADRDRCVAHVNAPTPDRAQPFADLM
jgi:hypothetical protein